MMPMIAGIKVRCPHCGEEKSYIHRLFCHYNPKRNNALQTCGKGGHASSGNNLKRLGPCKYCGEIKTLGHQSWCKQNPTYVKRMSRLKQYNLDRKRSSMVDLKKRKNLKERLVREHFDKDPYDEGYKHFFHNYWQGLRNREDWMASLKRQRDRAMQEEFLGLLWFECQNDASYLELKDIDKAIERDFRVRHYSSVMQLDRLITFHHTEIRWKLSEHGERVYGVRS